MRFAHLVYLSAHCFSEEYVYVNIEILLPCAVCRLDIFGHKVFESVLLICTSWFF